MGEKTCFCICEILSCNWIVGHRGNLEASGNIYTEFTDRFTFWTPVAARCSPGFSGSGALNGWNSFLCCCIDLVWIPGVWGGFGWFSPTVFLAFVAQQPVFILNICQYLVLSTFTYLHLSLTSLATELAFTLLTTGLFVPQSLFQGPFYSDQV